MADVVLDEEQIRIPVGFEIVIVAVAVLVDLVLIAVDEIGIWICIELERDAGERMRTNLVVVIEQRDELAVRKRERGIGRGGDVAIGLADDDFDPRILFLVTLENFTDVWLLRGI